MDVKAKFLLSERLEAVLEDVRYALEASTMPDEKAPLEAIQNELSQMVIISKASLAGATISIQPESIEALKERIELVIDIQGIRPSTMATLIELKRVIKSI